MSEDQVSRLHLKDGAEELGHNMLRVFVYFISAILIYFIGQLAVVGLGLFFRYLRIRVGQRVEPSAKRAIVITGATSGIGLALAKRFYGIGFTVFAAYYNNQEPGYDELKRLSDKKDVASADGSVDVAKMFLVHMDVRSKESIDAAANETELLLDKHGLKLFCLFNNSGIGNDSYFEVNSLQNTLNLIQTNYIGTLMVTKRFLLRIIKDKGRIVTSASGLFRIVCPGLPIYSSTKAAIASFSDSLDESLRRYGASCRCVCAGNLISKSNIVYSAIRGLQASLNQLTEEERNIYKEAIEESSTIFCRIRREREKKSGKCVERMEDIYTVKKNVAQDTKLSFPARLTKRLADCVGGSISSKETNLDETEVIEAFEDAVCAINPPRRLYPGNRWYKNVFGPLQGEYMNPILHEWFYRLAESRIRGRS